MMLAICSEISEGWNFKQTLGFLIRLELEAGSEVIKSFFSYIYGILVAKFR